ncbi:hypothetical protein GLOIN_2v101486 [Rhizophagus irregularis DAOM 181602=DAOM 197198]|nr:hypothetical protein GLOIN_2v101486 [Rhizophagus irregularis DAOM 181602=DAOM 197198]
MIKSLKSKELDNHNQLETKAYFHKNFGKYIRDYKFIPNVDLAVPLINNYFAFSINMPFLVSVHGYFAIKESI